MKEILNKSTGSKLYSDELNSVMSEVKNVVEATGAAFDIDDDKQLINAIKSISRVAYYEDVSTESGKIVLQDNSGLNISKNITEGSVFFFKAIETNTGSVTISVGDMTDIPLRVNNMSLAAGNLIEGRLAIVVYTNGVFNMRPMGVEDVSEVIIPNPYLVGNDYATEAGNISILVSNIDEIRALIGNIITMDVQISYGTVKSIDENYTIDWEQDYLSNMNGETTNRIAVKLIGTNGETGYSNLKVININPLVTLNPSALLITGSDFEEYKGTVENTYVDYNGVELFVNGEYVSKEISMDSDGGDTVFGNHSLYVKSVFDRLETLSSSVSEIVLEKDLNITKLSAIYTDNVVSGEIGSNVYRDSTDWNITLPYHNKYHRCNPFKETSTVDITGWIVDDNTLPEGLSHSQVVLTDKYCYLLGGYKGSGSYINKIYRANLNSDGTISNWIIDNQVIPGVLYASQVVLTDKYCYLLGGYNGSYTNKIYRANINSDGTISNWIIDNQVLPEVLTYSQVVLTDKYCYLLGGNNGSTTNKIYRANINSDGTISNWIIDNQVLPEVLYASQVVLTDKYCYLLGGSNGSATNKIYRANINSDGTISNWIIDDNTLLYGGWTSQVVQTKNRVWLIGIRDGSTNRNYVQYADITNGEISAFTAGTNLPGSIGHHMTIVTKSRVYTFGSYAGSNAIYSAPFDGWEIDSNLYTATKTDYETVTTNPYTLSTDWNITLPYHNQYHRCNPFKETSTVDITGWISDGTLPEVLTFSQVVLTDKYCYLLGGNNGSSYINKIYRANINSDGTISNWIIDNQVLPEVLGYSQVVLTDKYCYLLGGYNGSITNKIYRANLNSDGTISNWIIDNQVLPGVLCGSQVVLTDKYCYLLGGNNGSYTNKIYRANLNSDGTISNWIIDNQVLPEVLYVSQVVLTDKYCYLLGGWNGSVTNKIYRANLNSDGTISNWIIDDNTLLYGGYGSQVVQTKNRVWLIGIRDIYSGNGTNRNYVQYADITNGEIGVFTAGTSLPGAITHHMVVVTKSRVYTFGSYDPNSNVIYSAPFDGWEIYDTLYSAGKNEYTLDISSLGLTEAPEAFTTDDFSHLVISSDVAEADEELTLSELPIIETVIEDNHITYTTDTVTDVGVKGMFSITGQGQLVEEVLVNFDEVVY
jgi:ubiquitin-protein ligase